MGIGSSDPLHDCGQKVWKPDKAKKLNLIHDFENGNNRLMCTASSLCRWHTPIWDI